MKLYIKNMVCDRCIMVVQQELESLWLQVDDIKLGEVTLREEVSTTMREEMEKGVVSKGFEIIGSRKSRIIEGIKQFIIQLVQQSGQYPQENLSSMLSASLHYDYHYLSNLFSEVEGITIEKYYILQKMEKVKELLVYDELSLSEIAFRLNFSSVAYLSNQFKKITGLSPSHFKKIGEHKRKPLDRV